MTGSGRRRQATVPWHARIRRDLVGWGIVAALAAAVVLGLSGGGWLRALVLGLLVLAAFGVLAVLTAGPARPGRRGGHSGPAPGEAPDGDRTESPGDTPGP